VPALIMSSRQQINAAFGEVGTTSGQIDDLVPFNGGRLVFASRIILQTDESCIDIQD
jgi:hypothetical protein